MRFVVSVKKGKAKSTEITKIIREALSANGVSVTARPITKKEEVSLKF